jgi:hypothetical protein
MRRRAKSEGEQKIIAAVAARAVEMIGRDDEFAARMLASQFGDMASKQLNKDAVVSAALEDLNSNPPSPAETSQGPEQLAPDFMDRFQTYAEGASTDDLRDRWGRVLAGEIRKPGTFSRKVLRAVDELEPETAALFERICHHGQGTRIFKCLLEKDLTFAEKVALVSAGLLVDPGVAGHIAPFTRVNDTIVLAFNTVVVYQKHDEPFTFKENVLQDHNGVPAVPIYLLSDTAQALSTIINVDRLVVDERIVARLTEQMPALKLQHRPS